MRNVIVIEQGINYFLFWCMFGINEKLCGVGGVVFASQSLYKMPFSCKKKKKKVNLNY
jgi:hypothetical protein